MMARLENLALSIGAAAILLMGAMITLNVGLRLFGLALPDSIVLVRELMVAAIVLPLAAVTAARAHIAVEVLADLMPARVSAALVLLGWVVGLVAITPLVWAGWRELVQSWQSGAFFFGDLGWPKWPGRLVFVIGMTGFWLRLVALAVHDWRILRRDGRG